MAETLKYEEVLPILEILAGEKGKLGQLAKFALEHDEKILGAIGLIKKLLGKKKKQVEGVVEAAKPIPGPGAINPPQNLRKVTALRASLFFIERNKVAPFGIIPKRDFDRVKSDEGPSFFHDRVHLDVDPLDSDGVEIGPGSPDLIQMVAPDGSNKLTYEVSYDDGDQGPVQIHSFGDNFGCTPVLKVDRGANDGGEHYVSFRAVLGDVKSNVVRYRVKGGPGPVGE
jgi:hypothetical protein